MSSTVDFARSPNSNGVQGQGPEGAIDTPKGLKLCVCNHCERPCKMFYHSSIYQRLPFSKKEIKEISKSETKNPRMCERHARAPEALHGCIAGPHELPILWSHIPYIALVSDTSNIRGISDSLSGLFSTRRLQAPSPLVLPGPQASWLLRLWDAAPR